MLRMPVFDVNSDDLWWKFLLYDLRIIFMFGDFAWIQFASLLWSIQTNSTFAFFELRGGRTYPNGFVFSDLLVLHANFSVRREKDSWAQIHCACGPYLITAVPAPEHTAILYPFSCPWTRITIIIIINTCISRVMGRRPQLNAPHWSPLRRNSIRCRPVAKRAHCNLTKLERIQFQFPIVPIPINSNRSCGTLLSTPQLKKSVAS